MAAKDRSRGKALERYAGRLFGGRRRTNGEHGGYDDCVQLEGGLLALSIECKAYAKLQLREDWVVQARRNAGDRPWIVLQRPKGWPKPVATVDAEWLAEVCRCAGLIVDYPDEVIFELGPRPFFEPVITNHQQEDSHDSQDHQGAAS